jgi:ketosteroid isomerase-like protein
MSHEAIDLIHATLEAWRQGEETWAAAVGVEVEWENAGYPVAGMARSGAGREAFLEFMDRYQATWSPYEATVEELIDAGDTVVAVLRETVRACGEGPPIERDAAQGWTVDRGRIVRCRMYRTKEDAFTAVSGTGVQL